MRKIIWLILAYVVLLQTACSAPSSGANDGQINVVATIGQITDVVQIVGGEHVKVSGLMGAGVDPHLYVATEGDVSTLQEANIIFYNGLHLEAQMGEILEQLGESKKVVAVGETIDPGSLLDWQGGGGQYDPHIWFDVTLWIQVVETVRDTLAEHDPDHATDYQTNADTYLKELQTLHEYVQAQAERIPADQRILVTAHDAFNYFGRAYGFEVRGLQGISTESEAGTGDVQDLADFIAEKQIRAIFIESSVPVRNVEALQAAVEAKGWNVEIGGELFSDAMGSPGTIEGTYIGMVTHNIDTIVSALLGESQ